jgi:hypothetical protein
VRHGNAEDLLLLQENGTQARSLDFTMTRNTALWLVDNEEEIDNKGCKMKPYVLEEDFTSIEFHDNIATLQRRPGVAEAFDGRISFGIYVLVRLGRDRGIELEARKYKVPYLLI